MGHILVNYLIVVHSLSCVLNSYSLPGIRLRIGCTDKTSSWCLYCHVIDIPWETDSMHNVPDGGTKDKAWRVAWDASMGAAGLLF